MTALPDPQLRPAYYDNVPSKRLFAWLIDSVLILILTIVAVPFTFFSALFFFPILWVIIGFVYRVLLISGGSATLGMRIVAIEFRNHSGQRFSIGEAFMHTLIFSVTFSMVIPHLISVFLMLFSSRGQSLSDLILGSTAINRPAAS
jgi:uncharacterized RDD family membrane protein YckC